MFVLHAFFLYCIVFSVSCMLVYFKNCSLNQHAVAVCFSIYRVGKHQLHPFSPNFSEADIANDVMFCNTFLSCSCKKLSQKFCIGSKL